MTQAIVLLDHKKHGNLKIADVEYHYLAEQHIVPLTLHEFGQAACEYPIVFIRNKDSDEYQSVAMLGLKAGTNLSVKEGIWIGHYMPDVVADYPLGLILNPEIKDKVWIGIRESSSCINDEKGDALFHDEEETEYLQLRKKDLLDHYQQDQVSKKLIARLVELDLMVSRTLTIDVNNEKRDINGLFLIDESRLDQLSDTDFLELRNTGLLGPIYSHLSSLHQINRLVKIEMAMS